MAGEREWVRADEAMKLAGFVNRTTFLKAIRARRIPVKIGIRNRKFYSRAKMLELAREREAAEIRRARMNGRKGDPLTDPLTSGAIEAQVFKLFEARTSLVDVVQQLELPAAIVDHLFETWWRMRQRGQAWLNPQPAPQASPLMMPAPLDPSMAPVSFAPAGTTLTGATFTAAPSNSVPPIVDMKPVARTSETEDVLAKARAAAEAARKVAAGDE